MKDAAKLMAECDCGEIPVIDEWGHPIGVVTDRDIACRGVSQGKDALTPVREVMSSPAITANPDMSLDECCRVLEEKQIRRIPVVDGGGKICGIVSQADIALHATEHETAELLRDVSRPTGQAAWT
jgi:CBS domain-containing protein